MSYLIRDFKEIQELVNGLEKEVVTRSTEYFLDKVFEYEPRFSA